MPRELANAILWLAVVLPILAGIYGLWSLLRPPISERADRTWAIGCAAALALLAGGAIGAFSYLLVRGFTGRDPVIGEVLRGAVPVGGLVALAAIGGYAFLARRTADSTALAGVVLGPTVLILLPVAILMSLR